jgi:hypothetical protein
MFIIQVVLYALPAAEVRLPAMQADALQAASSLGRVFICHSDTGNYILESRHQLSDKPTDAPYQFVLTKIQLNHI